MRAETTSWARNCRICIPKRAGTHLRRLGCPLGGQRAAGTEHRAAGTEHRARSSGRRAALVPRTRHRRVPRWRAPGCRTASGPSSWRRRMAQRSTRAPCPPPDHPAAVFPPCAARRPGGKPPDIRPLDTRHARGSCPASQPVRAARPALDMHERAAYCWPCGCITGAASGSCGRIPVTGAVAPGPWPTEHPEDGYLAETGLLPGQFLAISRPQTQGEELEGQAGRSRAPGGLERPDDARAGA